MSRSKRLKTPLAWLLASEGQGLPERQTGCSGNPIIPNSIQFDLPALTADQLRRIAGLDLIVLVDPKATHLAQRECHGVGEHCCKCQTTTVTPAKPGDYPFYLTQSYSDYKPERAELRDLLRVIDSDPGRLCRSTGILTKETYGYGDSSHHRRRCAFARRWRLLRAGTLVLG